METIRLKEVRRPSQIERLLERLVTRAGLEPAGGYQLGESGGPSSAVQRVLTQGTSRERLRTCRMLDADSFRLHIAKGRHAYGRCKATEEREIFLSNGPEDFTYS